MMALSVFWRLLPNFGDDWNVLICRLGFRSVSYILPFVVLFSSSLFCLCKPWHFCLLPFSYILKVLCQRHLQGNSYSFLLRLFSSMITICVSGAWFLFFFFFKIDTCIVALSCCLFVISLAHPTFRPNSPPCVHRSIVSVCTEFWSAFCDLTPLLIL